jgi:hypothetical protein
MKNLAWLAIAFLANPLLRAEVVTYPAPAEESLCKDYQVWADGQKVDVYAARVLDPPFADKQWDHGGPYGFANFDVDGPVQITVRSPRSLRQAVIRPADADVQLQHPDDHTLRLTLPGPRKLSIEPDGKRGPLLLFANPPEGDRPDPDAPGVRYFAAGTHRPGKIELTSNQTLYLAGGAVVKGGIVAEGSHIRIMGRGILDGSDWPWRQGPTPHLISIRGSDIEVSGITIRGSSHWTIVPRHSQRVTIRDVKICNSRVQNDDGINPCNSQDVLITDCFIRSDDDCIALKGLDHAAVDSNVERITVENCTLWCDRARIFLLGHESRAERMGDVILRNLDIVHFRMTPFLMEPGEEMLLENVVIEDVRVHGEGQEELMRLRPVVNQYMRKKVPGRIRDVRVVDLTVFGSPGDYFLRLQGANAQHEVRDVVFDDLTILGSEFTADSPRLKVGEHVQGVRFVDRAQ